MTIGTAIVARTNATGSLWPGIGLHAVYDLAFRVMDVDPSTWHGRLYYTLTGSDY